MRVLNFTKFDHIHLGVSGGKDSTAAFFWAINHPVVKPRLTCSFADTQNEDPLTYAFLDYLREFFPIQTLTTIGFLPLAQKRHRFPSRMVRFCTEQLKVIPSIKHLLALGKTGRVLSLNGVRKGEGHNSNDRGSVPSLSWAPDYNCFIYRPILHYTIDDVWAAHKNHLSLARIIALVQADPNLSDRGKQTLVTRMATTGIPRNPLYDMGALRVGCFPCINSRKKEVAAIAAFRPQRIDEIREWEKQVGEAQKKKNGRTTTDGSAITSFFATKTTPKRFHSKTFITNAGVSCGICTIDDVVRWATEEWSADDILDAPDEVSACTAGGHCE